MLTWQVQTWYGKEAVRVPEAHEITSALLKCLFQEIPEWNQLVLKKYVARKRMKEHPNGTFSPKYKWYPVEEECCDWCKPMRIMPENHGNWFINHCRTKHHLYRQVYRDNFFGIILQVLSLIEKTMKSPESMAQMSPNQSQILTEFIPRIKDPKTLLYIIL